LKVRGCFDAILILCRTGYAREEIEVSVARRSRVNAPGGFLCASALKLWVWVDANIIDLGRQTQVVYLR